jgi:hypothetical protein
MDRRNPLLVGCFWDDLPTGLPSLHSLARRRRWTGVLAAMSKRNTELDTDHRPHSAPSKLLAAWRSIFIVCNTHWDVCCLRKNCDCATTVRASYSIRDCVRDSAE